MTGNGKTRLLGVCAALVVIMCFPLVARAQVTLLDSAPLQVSAEVADDVCSLIVPPLKFGLIESFGERQEKWLIWIMCKLGDNYKLSVGAGRSRLFSSRNLTNGKGKKLAYHLFFTAPDNSEEEWGDNDFENTYPPGRSNQGTGTGQWQTFTLTGKIFIDPSSFVGTYQDTVKITLHY